MCDARTDVLGVRGYWLPGDPTSVDESSRFSGLQTYALEDAAAGVSPVAGNIYIASGAGMLKLSSRGAC
jgi:hypothetical protein